MVKRWITIAIENRYFEVGHCDVEVVPMAETKVLLGKAGVLLRQMDGGKWVLLKPDTGEGQVNRADLVLADVEQRLRFYLRPLSDIYYFYAGEPEGSTDENSWVIKKETTENGMLPKVYLEIFVSHRLLAGTTDIRLTIPTRKKYWDVVLISRNKRTDYPLELREANGKLMFSVPQTAEQLTGKNGSPLDDAFHCVSETPVPMKETYPFRISLWEKREKGDVLISSHIPHPRPDSMSIINAKEMITSYFYF